MLPETGVAVDWQGWIARTGALARYGDWPAGPRCSGKNTGRSVDDRRYPPRSIPHSSAAVRTEACLGKMRPIRKACTSGSGSAQPSDNTMMR